MKGPNLVIHQEKSLMDGMDEWCTKHHGDSGLTKAVLESSISTQEAQNQVLEFIQKYTVKGTAPLAGNSVHEDKRFLAEEMPDFLAHLHYRIVDVSTLKELTRRWFPETFKEVPPKKGGHRALDDIKESIEELRWYQSRLFKDGLL